MLRKGLGLAGAILAAACGGAPEAAPEGGAQGGRGAAPAMPVEMRTLELKPVERVDEFVATVKSRRSTTIQPQAEGFLLRILVAPGERVAPGAAMFEIDAASQQATLSSLESVRAAREADATFARQQAERARGLLKAGAMSQQEHDQALTLQKTAEAQLKAIDEQLRAARTELAYSRVTAPTAGVVGDIPVRVGDRVTRATALTTVEDNSGLEVYVSVPVQQAPQLKVGLPVRIVNDLGEVLTTTRIAFVSPSVDDTTQTVLVKAPIDSRGGTFRSDQFVRTQIVLSMTPGLTVPVVSVTRLNGQYFAFVAEGGERGGLTARQRALTLGPVIGNEYVVLAGLKEGDRLILSGIQMIGDGAPVQPKAPAPPAAAAPGGGRGGEK
jgi:RND family efflux transporter MFP subunit